MTRRNSSVAAESCGHCSRGGNATGCAESLLSSSAIKPSFQDLRSSCQVPSETSAAQVTSTKIIGTTMRLASARTPPDEAGHDRLRKGWLIHAVSLAPPIQDRKTKKGDRAGRPSEMLAGQ